MRRAIGIVHGIVGAVGLALVVPSGAAAQPLERFSFAASPAQSGQPLELAFALGTKQAGLFSRFGIDLPAGAGFSGRDFPRCRYKTMVERLSRPGSICPRRTRAGAGKAIVRYPLSGGAHYDEHARITVVNGGTALHLIWKSRTDLPNGKRLRRTIIWQGRPEKQGHVTAWVPKSSPLGLPGQKLRLRSVNLRIAKTTGGRGIIEIGRCRNHRWRARGWMQFVDEESKFLKPVTKTDSVRCDP
jgi:hypothetical protein